MPEITVIPVEDIIAENFSLTGLECDQERARAVGACYSSFPYYDRLEEQIASIVASLVKDHFFVDGNKRTALSTYLVLSKANRLRHVEDDRELAEIFVKLAESQLDAAQCARLLYPWSA